MSEKYIGELNLVLSGVLLFIGIAATAFIRLPAGASALRWAVLALLALLALSLARTRVCVRPNQVSMRFTLPWPQRTLDVDDVESFRIVDIPWWVGWGFRWWFGQGWCWRAAGSRGVEFTLHSGSTFVLGCKDPERVVATMAEYQNWVRLRAL